MDSTAIQPKPEPLTTNGQNETDGDYVKPDAAGTREQLNYKKDDFNKDHLRFGFWGASKKMNFNFQNLLPNFFFADLTPPLRKHHNHVRKEKRRSRHTQQSPPYEIGGWDQWLDGQVCWSAEQCGYWVVFDGNLKKIF